MSRHVHVRGEASRRVATPAPAPLTGCGLCLLPLLVCKLPCQSSGVSTNCVFPHLLPQRPRGAVRFLGLQMRGPRREWHGAERDRPRCPCPGPLAVCATAASGLCAST